MKKIPLTRGKVALVDDSDFGYLNQFQWQASPSGKKGLFYATRMPWVPGVGQKAVVFMHREISGGIKVDHIDRDGLNNQRANLRPCNESQNNCNRGKSGKSSKFKGVCWDKRAKKWAVFISKDKKPRLIGRFGDEVLAAIAYDFAALVLHGPFSVTNASLKLI